MVETLRWYRAEAGAWDPTRQQKLTRWCHDNTTARWMFCRVPLTDGNIGATIEVLFLSQEDHMLFTLTKD